MRAATAKEGRAGESPQRRYPPLLAIVAALVLAVFALPSALNLPLANPGQSLEYAPVPGDHGQAPPGGNLAALSLGQGGAGSGGTGSGVGPGGTPLPPPSQTAPASVKNCVGSPPRQTEDPLSPPCVSTYKGDNGGATYKGVSGNEVRILFYTDPFVFDKCNSNAPTTGYYDMAQAQTSAENTCVSSILRTWQRYFNTRYQTYGRFVHFWLYVSPYNPPVSSEQRRADAEDNIAHVHPFAAIPMSDFTTGNLDAYDTAMLSAGVFVFTKQPFAPSSFYSHYAPLLWGYAPSQEEQAKNFVSYVCTRVANQLTNFAGSFPSGQTRSYGLVETTDPSNPALQQFQSLVAQQLKGCGVTFLDTAQYPVDGYAGYATNDPNYNSYAPQAMARFKRKGITTIIWPGGYETNLAHAAASLGYLPEWVVAGDARNDSYDGARFQDQTAWAHAAVVTTVARIGTDAAPQSCEVAFRSVDNNSSDWVDWNQYICALYPAIRQMFTGIQVAGPRLNPTSMDQGYHAIPSYQSQDPELPACFYDTGDYTCIKDAQAEYWDQTGTTANGAGCYRMVDGGMRHSAGHWPSGDFVTVNSNDVCNQYVGGAIFSGSLST